MPIKKWLRDWLLEGQPVPKEITSTPGVFTTDLLKIDRDQLLDSFRKATNFRSALDDLYIPSGSAMDANIPDTKAQFATLSPNVSDAILMWYSAQGFIGHQMCAIIAQHWLVDKACTMLADDSVAPGYRVTVNDGTEVKPHVLDAIRKLDVKYNLEYNLKQFIKMSKVFGIRVAIFKVESTDPDYYVKPFNIDGVTPGSYKGISQVDPYWISPELDAEAAGDPSSEHFYEPTWWRVNGKRYHRTHLAILRNGEVADILKPTYVYGGIPVPQKIYERVYAAERTANEGPQLALTKRTNILKVDVGAAMANQGSLEQKMLEWQYYRDNYATKVIGLKEEMEQHDTNLADLDVTIMTQYQIVSAGSNVPAVKLMGTTPKGFNATGQYEERNYHEECKGNQNGATPFLEHHHLLLIKSEIAPQFGTPVFAVTTVWNTLETATVKERAETNKLNAEAGTSLIMSGAITPDEERNRIVNDPDSGYSGIVVDDGEDENVENDPDSEEGLPSAEENPANNPFDYPDEGTI